MWDIKEVTSEELARLRRRYEPLTGSIRELIDAALRTEVDDDVAQSVKATIDAAIAQLRSRQCDGTHGFSMTPEGEFVSWGNMGDGVRNPVAPPLLVHHESTTHAHLDVDLGAAYEGAPGHLHGGYGALVLDHLLGAVASYGGPESVAATGTITLRYVRPTRLGRLSAVAEVQRREGRKIFLTGHLADADGTTVTVEAVYIALRQSSQ
jgi:acyl-coenzyme A thioesterase PaaI-like protein